MIEKLVVLFSVPQRWKHQVRDSWKINFPINAKINIKNKCFNLTDLAPH